ncbi:hypothetical protein BCR33DRAFT_717538 [Rhizoclosmatium globosum]|uniref:Uncharacterized protein n=1 Tax=Rhizoclosmatium globosum TaxID=329046 RepID=A0A1Y2C8Q8_9FUNG|nr:hypothetical protein BCR33DRAFT_717538 [Rhizoclosmatium globosum]|eukprot:ORY43297.1 hypothetical protein BCR33DRAFT_717538 [Rhizoclosmatium globosum]
MNNKKIYCSSMDKWVCNNEIVRMLYMAISAELPSLLDCSVHHFDCFSVPYRADLNFSRYLRHAPVAAEFAALPLLLLQQRKQAHVVLKSLAKQDFH